MTETIAHVPDLPTARDPRCPFDPPPGLYALREQAPIQRVRIWNGDTPWLVTGYEAVRAVLADDRISADMRTEGFPYAGPGIKASHQATRLILSMDPPEHTALRRALAPEFMIRKVEALRPFIQQTVDAVIETMLGGPSPADLVTDFALPVPSLVIAEMLGVPQAHHEYFQQLAEKMVSTTLAEAEVAGASRELFDYIARLADERRANPGPDLISRLAALWDRGEMSRDDVVGSGFIILVGGHETTANMISLSMAALLENPEQLRDIRVAEDPAVVTNAVEELLRYFHITQYGRRRLVTSDMYIAGQLVRAGEGIILQGNMADRDTEEFGDDPDLLDIHRERARRHVAFGYGIHQCLGQPIARAELQIALNTLAKRVPTLALAVAPGDIAYKSDRHIYGVHHLPVTW